MCEERNGASFPSGYTLILVLRVDKRRNITINDTGVMSKCNEQFLCVTVRSIEIEMFSKKSVAFECGMGGESHDMSAVAAGLCVVVGYFSS